MSPAAQTPDGSAAKKAAAPPKAAAKKAAAPRKAAAKRTAPAQKAAASRDEGPRKAAARKRAARKEPIAEPAARVAAPPTAAAPTHESDAETHMTSAEYVLVDPAWLERAYRLGVGSAVLAAASGGWVLAGPAANRDALPAEEVIDFGVGLSDSVFAAVQRSLHTVSRAVAPVAGRLRGPAARVLQSLAGAVAPTVTPVAERGRHRREEAEAELVALVESIIPEITDLILERIDLQAVLSRIDLQELVEASLEHVDMTQVMSKMDMTESVNQMMEQVDLTQIALDHVDMTRIMENAVKQVDMVALVRAQLEGVDLADLLISTPTSLASGALRQTTRFVRRGNP